MKGHTKFGFAVSLLGWLLMMCATVLAQGERGALNGIVTDQNGAVVAGAEVTATNIETNIETKATTTDAGVYRLPYMPAGKYKITVCTNLPCRLTWQYDAADYIQKKLGIGFGETTEDSKYTLVEGECMGTCDSAPVALVNNHRLCGNLSPEQIDQLLAELK